MKNVDANDTTNNTGNEVGDGNDHQSQNSLGHLGFGFFSLVLVATCSDPFETTKGKVNNKGQGANYRKSCN